jgi:DNA-nicking Smr family endonuclease
MVNRPRKPPSQASRRAIPRLPEDADPATFFQAGDAATSGFAEALAAGIASEVPDHLTDQEARRPSARLGEQLKNYPPPQAKCDCHGLTAAEAETALHRFLAQAGRTALRTVRIITGKGLHSPGGPVLRDLVESELRLLKKNGAIVAFRWENKEKERSGSVIVYL